MDLIYAPFHQHSAKDSPRDGVDNVEEIVNKHEELGFKSVLLTGHDSIAGQRELFELCEKRGMQPRIGIEWYMILNQFKYAKANKDVRTYESGLKYPDDKLFHITCVVKNEIGYQNLLKLKYLSSLKESDEISVDGYRGTYYKRGRITEELIFAFSEGLIYTSGCRLSIFNEYIQAGLYERAKELLKMFEKRCETFMIELHPAHNEVEETLYHFLKEYAFKNNVACLIANDAHYSQRGDLYKWNVLGATRRNNTISAAMQDQIKNDDFYIKSYDEMYQRVLQLNKGNVANTIRCFNGHEQLSEMINFKWQNRKAPKIHINDAENILYAKLVKGLEHYFGNIDNVPVEYKVRLRKEFEVAKITGNCSYYVLVADLIQWAKQRGHILPVGRGSAASLLMLYLLNITKVDPLVYGLIAERASNTQRLTEMDIDLDFSNLAVEDIVTNYLKPKFGESNIVNVANYGYVHLSSAIRYSMKYLEFEELTKNKVAKAIKQKFVEIQYKGDEEEEISPTIAAIENNDEFIEIFKNCGVNNYADIFKYAKGMENTVSSISIHASANLIVNKPIYELFPVKRVGDVIVSEFDMDDLKNLNTLKLDLLSVATYSKIDKTLKAYNDVK